MEKIHKKNIQLFALSYFVAIISLIGFYFFQDDTSEKVEETMESLIERTTTTAEKQPKKARDTKAPMSNSNLKF